MALTYTSQDISGNPVPEVPVKESTSGEVNLKQIRSGVVIKEVQIYRTADEGAIIRVGT